MPPIILIPSNFAAITGDNTKLCVTGKTVMEVVHNLIADFPQLRDYLLSKDHQLSTFVSIYLNDKNIQMLQNEETSVHAADTVQIIAAIAGG